MKDIVILCFFYEDNDGRGKRGKRRGGRGDKKQRREEETLRVTSTLGFNRDID